MFGAAVVDPEIDLGHVVRLEIEMRFSPEEMEFRRISADLNQLGKGLFIQLLTVARLAAIMMT